MSLIDQLLSQQIVLISVGVFFLFIMAAIGVALYPRIKARRAKIAKRKAAEQVAKETALAEAKATKEAARAARRGGRQAAAGAAAPAAPPTATGSVVVIPGALPAAPAAGTPTAAPAPAPAAPKPAAPAAAPAASVTTAKEEVTPEMQDLLSSVFSDEENTERQAILLKGTEAVSIEELLILSKAVMAQINGEQQDNIVRVKENQLQ